MAQRALKIQTLLFSGWSLENGRKTHNGLKNGTKQRLADQDVDTTCCE